MEDYNINEFIEALIGGYEPITTTRVYTEHVEHQDNQHENIIHEYSVTADGMAGVNFQWLFSAAILWLVLYSCYKMIYTSITGFSSGKRNRVKF